MGVLSISVKCVHIDMLVFLQKHTNWLIIFKGFGQNELTISLIKTLPNLI